MENLERNGPAFFKIMLGDFAQRLCIPRKFAAEHREFLSKTVELETDLPGKIWTVNIEEKDDRYWLTDGWGKFVQEYGLSLAYFSIFRFIGDSKIWVTVFEPNGSEKKASTHVSEDRPEATTSSASAEESDINDEELAELDNIQTNEETSFTFTWKDYMRNNMPIKVSFSRKMGLTKMKGVKMRNLKGDVLDVNLYHYTDRRCGFGGGWAAFVDASDFVLNKSYKFEFIRKEGGEILVQMSKMK